MIPQDLTAEVVKTAIQMVVENAFKYGLPAAKRSWERARKESVGKKPVSALKGNLVNRESAMRAIRAALDARNSTRVIYFYGSGGAGKTRLLEEARNIANSISSLQWVGILDLYHIDLHNILRLHSAIIENLDPSGHYFSRYRVVKEMFENGRRDGIFSTSSEAVVQAEIARINQLFIEEFNRYTSKYRTVIAFDTLENIGEEQDLIQRVFRLGEGKESLSVRQWLLVLCKEAKNTVMLLAGRPNEDFQHALEEINQDHMGRVESILVEGLTQSDTADILKVFARKAPRPITELLSQNAIMIWQSTRGLPVHVALLVELVLQSPGIFADETRTNNPELERETVRAFFDGENPDRRHFFFLALARKGLTPDLLNFLEQNWSGEECSARLTNAENLTLTKKRHGENELFLHDALYEMFDDFAPYSEEEKVYWFQRLREYYQKSKKKERLHREKPIVSILYYDLRCDFLKAFYHNFIRWSEIAIKGCEMELDAQLRNEVLIYMRNDSRHRNTRVNEFETVFIQDSATRWIRRLITQERYDQAIGLAKILLSLGANEYSSFLSSPSLLEIPEDSKKKLESSIINAHPIFWASLLIYYGESLTYLTKEPEKKVENIFQHAIGRLRKSPFGQDHPLWWFRNRLLGRAYDRLGYLARANGHYYKAAEYYRKALPFYEKAEIADEFAFTQNNLAFVLALLGDITGAKNAVENALTRRLEMGQRYPLALSYNTRGLIRALENPNSLDGQRDCELALSIFREIDIPRGIVLACNALGFILRQRGGRWVSKQCTQEKAIHWYSESEKYFEHVIEKFGKGEKIRLWEALNELGSLYRDWAHLLNHLKDPEGARKRFLQSLDFQRQALTLAQENNMRFQQVDTLDDTAETYLNLGDFDKAKKDNNFEEARKNIEGCKALIPPEFNLADAQKEPHPGEVYWLSLAKIQLREGMMNILMARRNLPPDSSRVADGIQQLLISFIYFQLFSKQPKYLEQKVCEILLILKELSIPGKLIGDIFKRVSGEYNFDFTALHSSLSKEYPYDEFS